MKTYATVVGAMAGLLSLCGCETVRATQFATPRARVEECTTLCSDVGMKLGAMVVMMSSAGCVCEPISQAGAKTSEPGGAASAGAATIIAVEEARRRHQRQSQQYHR